MKKSVLFVFISVAVCVLGGLIMLVCYMTGSFNKNEPETWFEPAHNGGVSDEKIQQIKNGMTLEEIVEIIGKPQRDVGSGVLIAEWDLKSGSKLRVAMNPAENEENFTGEMISWVAFNIETVD
ncbi:MAG: hypothetical protein IJU75_02265 [Clostridia bacterium]|nr:hypothetical protein [Clostridia bacterium]